MKGRCLEVFLEDLDHRKPFYATCPRKTGLEKTVYPNYWDPERSQLVSF